MSPTPEMGPGQRKQLELFMEELAASHVSLSSVREGKRAWETHVLDSLSGIQVPELECARRIADLGAGAGFPGVVMAVMLPETRIDLVESVQRKCDFMSEALKAAGIGNARPVCARSEDLAKGEGLEAYDAVTARAVAPLAALAELASPLLRENGVLVAWKGARDAEEEGLVEAISDQTAMVHVEALPVKPFASSRGRHLHILRKTGPTPPALPRRPGMARKRPLS